MSRPFDRSLWTRPGIPFEREEPDRPYAIVANQLQYLPWELPRPWLLRMLRRA